MLHRIRRKSARWRFRAGIYRTSLSARLRRCHVVHMLHIGKTGGTAVKHALRSCRAPRDVRIVMHDHKTALSDLPPWDDVFFFLRDPVSRYVSGFNSRLREGRPRYDKAWTADERDAFEHFTTPDELAVAIDAGDPELRKAARRAMSRIGHVRWHYSRWLGGARLLRARRRRIVLIGHQETLAEDLERLKDRLGLPADCRLPTDEAEAHRSPTGLSTELSERALKNLRTWYRQDYELIEACRDLERAAVHA